jgi:drug/metabolite transporter (DMT)-like permease
MGILVAGAISISFSPIIVKLLGRHLMGPISIAFWRTLLGGLILVVIARLDHKTLRLAAAPLTWCLFTGFFFSLDLSCWHYAIVDIGSGMATLLANTHVFATAVISYLVFKEKITLRYKLAAPAGIIGLALLVGAFNREVAFTSLYLRGVMFGLGSALMYAFYMVGIKKARDHHSETSPAAIMAWICLTAAVFLAVGSLFEKNTTLPPTLGAAALLLLLAVVGQALAWWGIVYSLKRIAIHHAALILLLQPSLAMLWGYLFFNETLAVSQLTGAVITLTAIYAGSIRR